MGTESQSSAYYHVMDPMEYPSNYEGIRVLMKVFLRRHTAEIAGVMMDYCPYEGLRMRWEESGGVFYYTAPANVFVDLGQAAIDAWYFATGRKCQRPVGLASMYSRKDSTWETSISLSDVCTPGGKPYRGGKAMAQ